MSIVLTWLVLGGFYVSGRLLGKTIFGFEHKMKQPVLKSEVTKSGNQS